MRYILEALVNYSFMLLIFIVLETLIYFYYKKKNIFVSKGFIIGWQLLACLMTAIFSITGTAGINDISKYGISVSDINIIPLINSDLFGFIMNIILFVPFGIALPLLWKKSTSFLQTVCCGFLFSLFIEISQLFNLRATDIDDLISNTIGSMIGFGIYYLLFRKITFFQIDNSRLKVNRNSSSNKVIRNSGLINMILIFFVYFFVGSLLISFITVHGFYL
jgi:glycopeptide antibiotics resistance protein